ncbi:MAG: hypothetical protein ACRDND_08820 [Streptosporangiaceae bacterium]
MLDRPAGGRRPGTGSSTGAGQALDATSNRIHARSPHLAHQPSVIIASERSRLAAAGPGRVAARQFHAADRQHRAVGGHPRELTSSQVGSGPAWPADQATQGRRESSSR